MPARATRFPLGDAHASQPPVIRPPFSEGKSRPVSRWGHWLWLASCDWKEEARGTRAFTFAASVQGSPSLAPLTQSLSPFEKLHRPPNYKFTMAKNQISTSTSWNQGLDGKLYRQIKQSRSVTRQIARAGRDVRRDYTHLSWYQLDRGYMQGKSPAAAGRNKITT